MSFLLKKLSDPKYTLNLKGEKVDYGATPDQTLHDEFSLNGSPNISLLGTNPKKYLPKPSRLDLDGKSPSKYLDLF
jgi:hypothetical protein